MKNTSILLISTIGNYFDKMRSFSLFICLVLASFQGFAQNTWTQKGDFSGTGRYAAVGFSIGTKGYVGTGYGYEGFRKDFWEYNPTTDTWTQKADFGGTARWFAVGFSIKDKGYIGTGHDETSYNNDFWEYNPTNNTWTKKADFGGGARDWAVGFAVGSKGYVGTGFDGISRKDFWEYNPISDAWTQKADFGGLERYVAVGLSISSKGYIGAGFDGNNYKNDFWEFDPNTNAWEQKADFAGLEREAAVGFSIGNKGYIGTGYGNGNKNDFWEYDQNSNSWTQKANFGGASRLEAIGFSIGSKGYIGTGYIDGVPKRDFWEYESELQANAGLDKTVYYGYPLNQCTTLIGSALGGTAPYQYLWSTGGVTSSISVCPSSTTVYTLTVTDAKGNTASDYVTVTAIDVRCNNNKIKVCHANKTICIASASIQAHLAHGDYLGDCINASRFAKNMNSTFTDNDNALVLYPNPSTGSFTIELNKSNIEDKVLLQIEDLNGRLIYSKAPTRIDGKIKETIELNPAIHSGMYFLKVITGEKSITKKLIFNK